MANENDFKGFDSSANVSYIHQRREGGEPPSGDGEIMRRVATLEKSFDRLDGKIDGIVRDVAEIKGKISNMPSTWQMIGVFGGLVGLLLAGSGVLFFVIRYIEAKP